MYFDEDHQVVEPITDIQTIEVGLAKSYVEMRRYWENMSGVPNWEGQYVNKSDFIESCVYNTPEDDSYFRGYVLSETPVKHVLYPPFAKFLQYFPNDTIAADLELKFCYPSFTRSNTLLDCDYTLNPFLTRCDEWAHFCTDTQCGVDADAFINLNPNSQFYGMIAAVFSTDTYQSVLTGYQFEDWLEIMITERAKLIIDGAFFGNLLEFSVSTNTYFNTRAGKITNILVTYVMLRDLAAIIAGYVTYSAIPRYSDEIPVDGSPSSNCKILGITADEYDALLGAFRQQLANESENAASQDTTRWLEGDSGFDDDAD